MPTVTQTTDLGGDRLLVDGLDDAGKPIQAQGWVSATTNYYPPDAYQDDGHRKPGAPPRAMTDAEKQAYALVLLAEQNPVPLPVPPAQEPVAVEVVDVTDTPWVEAPLSTGGV